MSKDTKKPNTNPIKTTKIYLGIREKEIQDIYQNL